MEIQDYLRLLRRWWWLILIAMAIGAGVSFITAARQIPVYRAQATVMIGQYIQSPNPNYTEIRTGMDLAATYVALLDTRPILEAAAEELNGEFSPEQLAGVVSAEVVENTSLIQLSTTYTDPVMAADMVNAVAHAWVSQSPTNLTTEQEAQITFLNGQIEILNAQVQSLRDRLTQIGAVLETQIDLQQRQELTTERDVALEQLNQATGNIAQFASTIAALQERVNSIQIVEEAIPRMGSLNSSRTFAGVMLYSAAAAALVIGLILVIEYLDDTIRDPERAIQMLGVPILGSIVKFGTRSPNYKDMLLVKFPPMSSVNESYRSARTNILHTFEKDKTGVLIITSANPQEGKTVTSSNMAISMAMSGMRVILIDADLRHPKVHEAFSLENKIGLTTLLFADPDQTSDDDTEGVEFANLPKGFSQCVQDSGIDKLSILTSGFIPSNPTELLASTAMAKWIKAMCESPDIDLIIIDSPPALAAANSAVLASNVGAQVVLVIDTGNTRIGAAKRAKAQFTQLNISLTGLIMNRVDHRSDHYGYYYGYYYSSDDNSEPTPKGLRALLKRNKARV